MNYDWNFARLTPYGEAFAWGTLTTVCLTGGVIIVGTVFGILLGVLLRNNILRYLFYPIIDVIRALPPLVLILFMYYLLSEDVVGTAVHANIVSVIAMSLNLTVFTADLVRAAIENVPRGEKDAGIALGMTDAKINQHIVLPHVVREILPGMLVLYLGMLKMSSLASVISVREIVYAANTVIANVSRSLEAWVIVAVIYVILVLPSTYILRYVEARIKRMMA